MSKTTRIILSIGAGIAAATATVFAFEVLVALNGPKEPPFSNPSHDPVHFGKYGTLLTFVVIGDSTGAGQGAPYIDGIAMRSAEWLAQKHRVKMTNLSVSGATSSDVVREQLRQAAALKPDLVLLSVGANDSTHFLPSTTISTNLDEIADDLRKSSPNVKIVVTGCPQMGSVPRFMQPLRWFAGTQTDRINHVFKSVVEQRNLSWSRIAELTGPIFQQDPTLFASDRFHPNQRGYAVWLKVLERTYAEVGL